MERARVLLRPSLRRPTTEATSSSASLADGFPSCFLRDSHSSIPLPRWVSPEVRRGDLLRELEAVDAPRGRFAADSEALWRRATDFFTAGASRSMTRLRVEVLGLPVRPTVLSTRRSCKVTVGIETNRVVISEGAHVEKLLKEWLEYSRSTTPKTVDISSLVWVGSCTLASPAVVWCGHEYQPPRAVIPIAYQFASSPLNLFGKPFIHTPASRTWQSYQLPLTSIRCACSSFSRTCMINRHPHVQIVSIYPMNRLQASLEQNLSRLSRTQ